MVLDSSFLRGEYMSSGYVFALSNPLYTDFLYVGISMKTPKERAQELCSEGVLYPFEVVMAKTVAAMDSKLVTLHKLLGKFGERPSPDKDFFKIDRNILDDLFNLIDGQPWIPSEITPEAAWNLLLEKVGMILKNENPKLNEFQIGKMRIKIAQILKSNGVAEPTLESVREAVELAKVTTVTTVPI